MREFEIDVSGEDLLSKNYTICAADKDSVIKGFKFNEKLTNLLSSRYGQGLYKYHKSQKGKALPLQQLELHQIFGAYFRH